MTVTTETRFRVPAEAVAGGADLLFPAMRRQIPPGMPLSSAEVSQAIATAARAPSVHNTQPWLFRVSGSTIELLADRRRQLRKLDPAGRELIISCGAALFGLRLGFRQLGLIPQAQLLPDPADDRVLARVWATGRAAPTRTEAELAAALPHRHTHRGPFSPGEVSWRLLAALAADAAAEGSQLRLVTGPAEMAGLARLVTEAASIQRGDDSIAAEQRTWVRPPGSTARDGVPARATARWQAAGRPAAPAREGGQPRLPVRDFGRTAGDEAGGAEPSATAVLVTRADTVADWLRAGQGLHRLLLRAATRWVFASLQTQPIESRLHRDQVRSLLGLAGQPQMLMQFGRSNSAAATPRRPHGDIRLTR